MSPWALGFSVLANATSAVVVTGAVVLVLALWTLATDPDYGGWLQRRAH